MRLREPVREYRWDWGSLGFNVRECVFWITKIEPNPFITEKYVHEGDYNRMYAGRVACISELCFMLKKPTAQTAHLVFPTHEPTLKKPKELFYDNAPKDFELYNLSLKVEVL